MAIKYRFDVLQWLKAAGFNSGRLRREKLLGQSTLTKLRRGELLSWGETSKVCEMLHVQPGDLFEYIPEAAEGATVPGPSEFGRGVDAISAAVGASVWMITDGITKSRVSYETIAGAADMPEAQRKILGEYLSAFADGSERTYKAEG